MANIDRADFIRSCERDIRRCATEAAREAMAGYLVNALVWQVKIPQLLGIIKMAKAKQPYEQTVGVFELRRVQIMTMLPESWARVSDVATQHLFESNDTYANPDGSGVTRVDAKVQLSEIKKLVNERLMESTKHFIGVNNTTDAQKDMIDAVGYALHGFEAGKRKALIEQPERGYYAESRFLSSPMDDSVTLRVITHEGQRYEFERDNRTSFDQGVPVFMQSARLPDSSVLIVDTARDPGTTNPYVIRCTFKEWIDVVERFGHKAAARVITCVKGMRLMGVK